MNKFKVGDEVIAKESHELYQGGMIHIVEYASDDGFIKVEGCSSIYYEIGFQPAKPKPAKWHPHHDKIIKWLENEGSVVHSGGAPLDNPRWFSDCTYQVVAPQDSARIKEIKSQIKELQEELEGLESA